MQSPNFAQGGGIFYGNDQNPLSGRYQDVKFSGWQAGQNLTTGTAGSTQIALPQPPPLESLELLDLCVFYPAASGSVSTPASLALYKTAAGTNSPGILLVPSTGGINGAGLAVVTEANIPINTVRKFSLATFTTANFQPNQVGHGSYSYPSLNPGDLLYLLLNTLGVGGVQTGIMFGYLYRERPTSPVAPALANSGFSVNFQ